MGTDTDAKPDKAATSQANSSGSKPTEPKKKDDNQSKGGRRRGRRGKGGGSSDGAPSKVKFTGACSDLKGSIYHTGVNQADLYIRSTKAIAIYVGKHYTMEARQAIESLKWPIFEDPTMPTKVVTDSDGKQQVVEKTESELTYIEKRQLDIKLKKHEDKKEQFIEDMHQIYSLIEGQCTDAMIQQAKADDQYTDARAKADPVMFLTIIKKICYSCITEQFPILSLSRSLTRLTTLKQGYKESNVDYLQRFNNALTVYESCGGSLLLPGAMNYAANQIHNKDRTDCTVDELKQVRVMAKNVFAATLYIDNASPRYKALKKELANDFLKSTNNYPEDTVAAQSLLLNYNASDTGNNSDSSDTKQGNQDVMFAQTANTNEDQSKRKDLSHIVCTDCGESGHYPRSLTCPAYKSLVADAAKHRSAKDTAAGQTTKPDNKKKTTITETGEQVLMHGTAIDTTKAFTALAKEPEPAMFCQTSTERDATVDYFEYSDSVLSQGPGGIDRNWCLLDNQSTCNVFVNERYLTNIRRHPEREMHINCNAGTVVCNTIGDLPGFGPVWYHPNGIANVLSLAKVKDKYRVTYDSDNGNAFEVHSPRRPRFIQAPNGLYYYKMGKPEQQEHLLVVDANDRPYERKTNIKTVESMKAKYSNRDVQRADKARRFQEIIGASLKATLRIIDNKLLANCPITRDDIKAAENIYGPSATHLQGKTTRKTPEHVDDAITTLPPNIAEKYRLVTLCADIMGVNEIKFLTTVSRNIGFGTATHLKDMKSNTLLAALKVVAGIYMKRGFTVRTIHMDGQFESIKTQAAAEGLDVNVVSRGEHVPEIERYHRTIKERARSIRRSLPFQKVSAIIIIEIIAASIFWLNAFPRHGGVSKVLSPREIVTGIQLDYNRHCSLQFGEYVQVYEETDNTMKPRTVGAIALRPTGNRQGGYYYYSLLTGRRLNRGQSTSLPMPAEAIARVEELAKDQPATFSFTDRTGTPIPVDQPLIDVDFPSDDSESTYQDESTATDDDSITDNDSESPDDHSVASNTTPNITETAGVDNHLDETEANQNEHPETTGVDTTDPQPTETPGVQQPRRSARQRNPINYRNMSTASHLKTIGFNSVIAGTAALKRIAKSYVHVINAIAEFTMASPYQTINDHINHTIATQYSVQKGLKIFGEAGADAVSKELQQVHDRKVIKPCLPSELTKEQRARALSYLMFLKQKRDGSIKGRGCADGRKQRDFMSKEDTSSPTVAIETLILSCMIDAMEGRDVATADIPGAFLQTEYTKGDTHVVIEGAMVDLLVAIDPELYQPYVTKGPKGRQRLYAETTKAMYGTLNAALLFWLKLSASLRSMGFVANPYDWCCMNKQVEGSQCTIVWHVDDIKVSHINPNVVTEVLEQIDREYGQISPLTVTRGKTHEYLGMTIDYSIPGKVKFTMIDYVNKLLNEAPADMSGESATPAGAHLFDINETDPTLLSQDDATLFHHLTAMLLFLAKRARPDIQLAVAFLCTRVRTPDTDDYKKLTRVIKYLRGTIGLPLIISMESAESIRWYVDAAFAVHNDMKSHTGAIMTFGTGAAYAKSSKQKLNTKSSTEAEFVGVDDILPQVLWTRYFLNEQGYNVKDNVVYQDNQSAMKLEKNGMRSSSKRTRHINIRYYFITDRIAANEVSVEYCPTLEMIGDYFTKPLQGTLFRKFRNYILGIDNDDIPRYNSTARAQLLDSE